MAFIAHALELLGMIGFFEFLVRHPVIPLTLTCSHQIFLYLVIFGTLGHLSRCPRSRCRDFHSARRLQYLNLRAFDPRVQTRRDKQSLVDRKVVRKEPWCVHHVTSSRICRQDHHELPVEFGLLDWTGSALHASATYLDPLR